ncbi:MAG: DUF5711 family protein [Eubacteriales bacterium]|nr:DUF5711 family protein [Eubacteriales bacterium]
MADNQREMQRREKKAKKDRKNKIIIWSVIAVVIVILAVMKICEVNINSVKDRFTDADGNFTISQGVSEGNFPYNIDSSKNVVIKNVNKKLGVLTPLSFTVLDSNDAESEYSFEHGYSSPILKTSGIYTLIYDQGAKNMRLDTTSKAMYEMQTNNTIFCADVAKNGSVVYACASDEKKCDVHVLSKTRKELLSYSTSEGYIVAAAINDSGNKIAFVTVKSENAQLKYVLTTMNVGSDEVKASTTLPLGNVVELKYSSSNIYVVGDDYLAVVKNQKELEIVFDHSQINTVSYTFTPSNELVLVYNSYANSTENVVARISSNGKVKKETKLTGTVKSISASSNAVSIYADNEITTLKLSNLEKSGSITTDDSIKSICRMGSEVFVHRQSLIDRSEAETK